MPDLSVQSCKEYRYTSVNVHCTVVKGASLMNVLFGPGEELV